MTRNQPIGEVNLQSGPGFDWRIAKREGVMAEAAQ